MTEQAPVDAAARLRRSRPSRLRTADGGGAARGLRVLASDLRDLALDLQASSYTRTTAAMFQRDLRQAVPSALGASISFDLDAPTGTPKAINLVERALDPAEIASGLRIPLILPQQSLSGSVLLYASEPGAFTDVVKSLATLLDAQPELIDESPTLPSSTVRPSVVAVEDFSLVNEALGVLINRGFTLTEARVDLQDCATRDHTGLPGAARRLLDGLPTRHGARAARLLTWIAPGVPRRSRRSASDPDQPELARPRGDGRTVSRTAP
jgi:hypothetical protein